MVYSPRPRGVGIFLFCYYFLSFIHLNVQLLQAVPLLQPNEGGNGGKSRR